jgi:hypothetical protein
LQLVLNIIISRCIVFLLFAYIIKKDERRMGILITIANDKTSSIEVDEPSSFLSLPENQNLIIPTTDEDGSEALLIKEEFAGDDFDKYLLSLEDSEEDLDLRELMVQELLRQGISDPVAYLGKGGIDITMRVD